MSRSCAPFREQMVLRQAGELADDRGLVAHLASCAPCARQAELGEAAWEMAGLLPEEPVPGAAIEGVYERIERASRRPRGFDLTPLRPGAVAAAAVLILAAAFLLRPGASEPGSPQLYHDDGESVERYEAPPGVSAGTLAEDLRREVEPGAWGEGAGLEVGEGFVRVRASAEIHRLIREHLARRK